MKDTLQQARQATLHHYDIDDSNIHTALSHVMAHQVDFADVYFQSEQTEGWSLEERLVKDASFHNRQGVGVRAISGEKTGFAYADVINPQALTSAVMTARNIAKAGQQGKVDAYRQTDFMPLYPTLNPVDTLSSDEKIDILQKIDQLARGLDPRVKKSVCQYGIIL